MSIVFMIILACQWYKPGDCLIVKNIWTGAKLVKDYKNIQYKVMIISVIMVMHLNTTTSDKLLVGVLFTNMNQIDISRQ